jgi:hypothetical protein
VPAGAAGLSPVIEQIGVVTVCARALYLARAGPGELHQSSTLSKSVEGSIDSPR